MLLSGCKDYLPNLYKEKKCKKRKYLLRKSTQIDTEKTKKKTHELFIQFVTK